MIDVINKEIKKFLSSIDNNKNIKPVLDKYTTSISDDLDKGHITTNVCMVAASVLKANPIELANNLKEKLKSINCFEDVQSAGPGFINIFLKREDFVSTIGEINKFGDSYGESNIGNR